MDVLELDGAWAAVSCAEDQIARATEAGLHRALTHVLRPARWMSNEDVGSVGGP